jgi:hypothetical protein
LTLKAIPGAVIGSNLGKTSNGSYKGFTNEKKNEKIFFTQLKNSFYLRGKIVPPPIMAQSKIFLGKILIF